MSRVLIVYLKNKQVGKLIQSNTGQLSFRYEESYMLDLDAQQISIAMPLGPEEYKENVVRAFFSGLLPDAIARHKLAKYLGVSEKNAFKLLEAIGGECAGALALYPEGDNLPSPLRNDIEILSDSKLLEIIMLLKKRPLMVGADNIRLSLAGAQDKLAVGLVENKIALIHGATPTTHILKPLIDDFKDSVHNEFFCMQLAANIGIKVPKVEIRCVDDTPYFLVERYDRIININKTIVRVHQEDFCQALGIMPEMKYEREGGPNVGKSLDLLQKYSLTPAADRRAFIQRLIFNYLIGNADAHGKNYSLLYAQNTPILSPAYDLLSTEVYDNISLKMAMKIGSKYDPYAVMLRHWHRLVPDTAVARHDLNKELIKMSDACLEQSQVLLNNLQGLGINSSIFDDICIVIRRRVRHIKQILSQAP